MSMMEFALNDVACTGCIGRIKRKIQQTDGIAKVKIVSGSGKIQIAFNEQIIPSAEISRRISKLTLRIFD
ncbi:heavy-metal-associated domain-containing protein [Neobacillus jeddahensis]|uniref:heavy-metal-associated domain-containing protein n=1 Tax=Neobacillus jeddahensis TaxID=1461580 RepID=UPI00058D98AB|nr:heavy-metal-associated domain-containing protein [Neobacillus jeddahensis]